MCQEPLESLVVLCRVYRRPSAVWLVGSFYPEANAVRPVMLEFLQQGLGDLDLGLVRGLLAWCEILTDRPKRDFVEREK